MRRVCSSSCQLHCPSLRLYTPWAHPLLSSRLAGVSASLRGSASGRPHPRKNRVSCQEGLGNSQAGQDCQERLGWGHRAGPFRLEEPVYLLPGVGLCSEGRRQWLEYIKPRNMTQ